ncbi:conserved hypothetical protein [Scheffersomyces stipitis CBS 6054]|uniref:Uncharacterized protein n=1 Tax=Scheffersomyces stipitis (strain ATCC 58785 / CBS 6054 / NBRC 10063 / NRRL Y-11545) TaxID=322104 RepID=A3GI17_PICST|nr:conserved hypothetical protein [Scheffersomyces stipitis CBS 6054]EAZ63154.2 conserved hypothetical protein [Scheffersomyces stipitis CBS 6054]
MASRTKDQFLFPYYNEQYDMDFSQFLRLSSEFGEYEQSPKPSPEDSTEQPTAPTSTSDNQTPVSEEDLDYEFFETPATNVTEDVQEALDPSLITFLDDEEVDMDIDLNQETKQTRQDVCQTELMLSGDTFDGNDKINIISSSPLASPRPVSFCPDHVDDVPLDMANIIQLEFGKGHETTTANVIPFKQVDNQSNIETQPIIELSANAEPSLQDTTQTLSSRTTEMLSQDLSDDTKDSEKSMDIMFIVTPIHTESESEESILGNLNLEADTTSDSLQRKVDTPEESKCIVTTRRSKNEFTIGIKYQNCCYRFYNLIKHFKFKRRISEFNQTLLPPPFSKEFFELKKTKYIPLSVYKRTPEFRLDSVECNSPKRDRERKIKIENQDEQLFSEPGITLLAKKLKDKPVHMKENKEKNKINNDRYYSRLNVWELSRILELDDYCISLTRAIEINILEMFQNYCNFKVGYQTWIRGTTRAERVALLDRLHSITSVFYPEIDKFKLEIIIRRATYSLMQTRLRRDRRYKK